LVRAVLLQHAEQQITEKAEKLLHAIEVRIATLSALGNTLPGTGGLTIAAGRLALLELQMRIAYYRQLPAKAYHGRFRTAKSAQVHRGSSLRCAACR
jgi:hypothetical protein